MHGLRMTLNVQQYESLPFFEQDSGLKVSFDRFFLIVLVHLIHRRAQHIERVHSGCSRNCLKGDRARGTGSPPVRSTGKVLVADLWSLQASSCIIQTESKH